MRIPYNPEATSRYPHKEYKHTICIVENWKRCEAAIFRLVTSHNPNQIFIKTKQLVACYLCCPCLHFLLHILLKINDNEKFCIVCKLVNGQWK